MRLPHDILLTVYLAAQDEYRYKQTTNKNPYGIAQVTLTFFFSIFLTHPDFY